MMVAHSEGNRTCRNINCKKDEGLEFVHKYEDISPLDLEERCIAQKFPMDLSLIFCKRAIHGKRYPQRIIQGRFYT